MGDAARMNLPDLWHRFERVESLSETDPSPIVRAVRDNTKAIEANRVDNDKEHKQIRLQVYLFMAVTAGTILGLVGRVVLIQ